MAYAVYWRLSVNAYAEYKKKYPNNVSLIKFEDLVKDPKKAADHIADFAGVKKARIIEPRTPNTSFKKLDRQTINGLEQFLLKKITKKQVEYMNYNIASSKIVIADLSNFMIISLNFTIFQLRQVFKKNHFRYFMEKIKNICWRT
jgi:hypothetical protein